MAESSILQSQNVELSSKTVAEITNHIAQNPSQAHPSSKMTGRFNRLSRGWTAYLFLLPGFLLFGLFVIFPMLYSLRISVYDWNVIKPDKSEFVGLAN